MAYLFHSAHSAFPVRHAALAALMAVLSAGPAHALAPELDAEREAREAQQALSDRYTMLWTTLGAGERANRHLGPPERRRPPGLQCRCS